MVAYRTSAQATSPRLLMKVSNQFYIANAAECTVAQALVPEVIHSCRVQGMAREDHILTLTAQSLTCRRICPVRMRARRGRSLELSFQLCRRPYPLSAIGWVQEQTSPGHVRMSLNDPALPFCALFLL
jgi:hypothetical protein